MIDTHIHTEFSHDSFEPMERYILRAIEKGLPAVGFSEHCDGDFYVNDDSLPHLDVEAYMEGLFSLREKYAGKITVLFGIEIGFDQGASEVFYHELLKKFPFDYVINSIHMVQKEDCYAPSFFAKRTREEAFSAYLKDVIKSLDATFPYQIIGHIGYGGRRSPYPNPRMPYADFPELFDTILTKIIARGVALEVNTKIPFALFQPEPCVLKRYFELGGRRITLGSDAHTADRLCDHFDKAVRVLKDIGFTEILFFQNMKEKAFRI